MANQRNFDAEITELDAKIKAYEDEIKKRSESYNSITVNQRDWGAEEQKIKNDMAYKLEHVTKHNGAYYTGNLNKTQRGLTCQNWTSQSPHSHTRTNSNYPNRGIGNHNYCRNPDGEPRLWCYTTDQRNWVPYRWDFCNTNSAKDLINKEKDEKIQKLANEKAEYQRKVAEQQQTIDEANAITRAKISEIKKEREGIRQANDRRIQEIRDEKHNKHWNITGKNEKRTFECNDVNGNKLGEQNLYFDNAGVVYANDKPIIQISDLNKGLPNPKWMKTSSKNYLYPYDAYNNKGDKIEYQGNSLVSSSNVFKLEMTKEGNLVLKKTIQGCKDNYTKKENIGDFKSYKTDATDLMNKYMLINNSNKSLRPISNDLMEGDNTYKYIGNFIPEDESNRTIVQNKEECFQKCNEDNDCGHVYYMEHETGDNYCVRNTGIPSKFIPTQPGTNIKKSSLYIRNKKMKSVQSNNLSEKDAYILKNPNKSLPNREVKHISNYNAYSDYEISNTPITQYQELLGTDVAGLKDKQTRKFEGFKTRAEMGENELVKDFINKNQIQPLEKMEDEYTKKLDKVNDNYNELDTDISSIINADETGLRDQLMNNKKYKNSFLSVDLDKSKDVSDVRLDDTKEMIEYNDKLFSLGIITASTLLLASIVIARE